MRPVAEQTILITGATDGLGRALAEELAGQGATVLLHGRDEERLRQTAEEIRAATGNEKIRTYLADFSSLWQVADLAQRVREAEDRLDVLVNNAGIGTATGDGERMESEDGYELRFAVNYLAPFLLSRELLPLLRASAPARIVNVASAGQAPLDFDDPMLEHSYDGSRAYAQSKLAMVADTLGLAEDLAGSGVTVTAIHPGTYMPTKMVREAGVRPITPLEDGVEATARLAVSPDLEGVSGAYFDGTEESAALPQAYDEQARRQLFELSERLVSVA